MTAAWKGFVNASVTLQGNSFTAFSPADPARLEVPSSTVATLRFGAQSERYQIALFADNITDERAVYDADIDNGIRRFTYARPRTIGLELDVNFD